MNLPNMKICKKCKKPHDFKDCPFCRQKELVWGSKEWNEKYVHKPRREEENRNIQSSFKGGINELKGGETR